MLKQISATLIVGLLTAQTVLATGTPGPLDDGIFDYSSDDFLPFNFSAGTQLTYAMFESGQFDETTTGLNGFTLPSDQVEPIPGFTSGQEVPLGGQGLSDLFPDNVPFTINDMWADNSISGVGNFQDGFTEFSTHQRKVTDIGQPDGPFIDGQAIAKNYTPFEINDVDDQTIVNLDIHLDSLVNFSGDAFLSEGVSIQLINVTDPENPTLMTEVSGFYFTDEVGGVTGIFTMGDNDLSDNFTVTPTGSGPTGQQEAVFSYQMDIPLDPNNTYGVAVIGDASTGASGTGTSYIDSSNTLDVAIRVLDTGARLTIPGFTGIPEPATGTLLLVLCSGLVASRRIGRSRFVDRGVASHRSI
ncbi:MAG: hypothetical protein RH917_20320 [Lacipirellulaceae bacterium]